MKSWGLFALVLSLAGCGVQGALDATQQIPPKLDSMNDQVTKTNDGMTKTNLAIHRQVLAVALSTMLTDQNTAYLDTPTLMMPAGQVFADEADAFEIVQLAYVMLNDVNNSTPDPLTKNKGESDDDFSARLMAHNVKVNHDKFAEFTAVQIIAGLMSQDKTEALVQAQIQQNGQYEDTAYQVLMLRHEFIRNTLLESNLLENKLANLGEFREAVKQARFVEYIARLPFAAKIGFKISGMQMPVPDTSHFVNVEAPLDTTGALATWQEISKQYARNLDAKLKRDPSKVKDAGQRGQITEANALEKEVNQKISAWTLK